jgi:hypothetical protein
LVIRNDSRDRLGGAARDIGRGGMEEITLRYATLSRVSLVSCTPEKMQKKQDLLVYYELKP